jgi:hypothetical protein
MKNADYEASEGERLGKYAENFLCVPVKGYQARVNAFVGQMDDETLTALSEAISTRLHAGAVARCAT